MNVDTIIANARAATGLEDLGDPSQLEGLPILVKASNEEARLSERGAAMWEQSITNNLINRMKVVDYAKKHPELLERPIEKPTFVFGLPRTGTTLTINLLSADPARRCYRRFESLNSVPPPGPDYKSDERYINEVARGEMALKYMPHIAAIHWEDADSPSEDQFSMAQSFCSQVYDSQVHIPSYREWFFQADYKPAFRFQKQILQVLQEKVGGKWTLKNPWHPLFLNDLTTVFPDAELVMTHRDPVEVVGSACSLLKAVRPMYSDSMDPGEIAECLLQTFDQMIARSNAYREKHGEDAIFDIQYAAQLKDPIGTQRALYERFGTPFTPEAQAGMEAMMAFNPKGKHGKHEYTLEEFGLSAKWVRNHFKEYTDRFSIPVKDAD
ncbi:sulfotransferase [Novosphingobium sp. TH158]|uniref:sulfotransferase family protein n=1 Tax=Novosphingobium sp. TH158 TaxID=2067455 RepID=UPI000C7A38A4|nr:sulfotransferase [Novosphingobium sp. TH158]PLK24461.1 sulfotransferase [Novosphingobium sp. TH158]